LHEGWVLKNSLCDSVSNDQINATYRQGLEAGALGGKLLGAGGGGFILFFVPPERRESVTTALGHLETIPIQVNAQGTQIIHTSKAVETESGNRRTLVVRAA